MDMPRVSTCNATLCAFNEGHACHALAITVGDERAPRCDTYCECAAHAGDVHEIAGVGACKMDDCEYNDGLYCTASNIQVKSSDVGPICVTYNPIKAHAVV
jgi:hypothetical protein